MPNPLETLDEDLDNVDMAALGAVLEGELFGQDSTTGTEASDKVEQESPESTPKPEVETPAPVANEEAKTEGDNAPAVVAVGAPKTWSKGALEKWATIDPVVQAEITKREEDMFRGIEEYKSRAETGDRYQEVVKPFQEILEREQVDPVQLFQAFASNHFIFSAGTPEQKNQLGAMLVRSYGLDLDQIGQLLRDNPQPAPQTQVVVPPEIDQRLKQLETQETERQRQVFSQQVDQFAADPKNIYFKDVSSDMATLLKTGAAKSLPEAYERAIWANPVTKQKEIDRLAAEKIEAARAAETKRLEEAKKATGGNVKTTQKNRGGTAPVGSMEETLEETMAQIKSRG
jgi:hypothetical protein